MAVAIGTQMLKDRKDLVRCWSKSRGRSGP